MDVDRKVAAGAAAGAIIIVLAWIFEAFMSTPIPGYVQAAGQTIIVFVIQWWVNNERPTPLPVVIKEEDSAKDSTNPQP